MNKNKIDITISLPEELIGKLEKKTKETNFDSISDYVTYVLKQVLEKEIEREVNYSYSKEEEKMAKEQLKKLGYI